MCGVWLLSEGQKFEGGAAQIQNLRSIERFWGHKDGVTDIDGVCRPTRKDGGALLALRDNETLSSIFFAYVGLIDEAFIYVLEHVRMVFNVRRLRAIPIQKLYFSPRHASNAPWRQMTQGTVFDAYHTRPVCARHSMLSGVVVVCSCD